MIAAGVGLVRLGETAWPGADGSAVAAGFLSAAVGLAV
jgi:hypothetical protein